MKGGRVGLMVLAVCAGSAGARAAPWSNLPGLSMKVGAGVEGYTRALAPQVEPGVTYGVALGLQPSRVVGLEVGYSGAVNGLEAQTPGGPESDADLVRNGAYAAATVGVGSSAVQPYVLGGVGFSNYNVRGTVPGFGDDTVGTVPLGAGVRTAFGTLTADARLAYDILFDQRFFAGTPAPDAGGVSRLTISRGGRYSGTFHLGMTW